MNFGWETYAYKEKEEIFQDSGGGGSSIQTCPCGGGIKSIAHVAGGCELYKQERDTVEWKMCRVNEGGMNSFCAYKRENLIAAL